MDVIAAIDLNAHPTHVVDAAVRWAERLGARLHLRTVSSLRWDAREVFGSEDQALTGEWERVRRAEASAVRHLLEHRVPEARRGTAGVIEGEPDEALAAAGHDFDLVICATGGRQGLARLFFGSTSEAIVRASVRPTLVLRMEDEARGPAKTGRVLVPVDPAHPSREAIDAVARWFTDAEITLAAVLPRADLASAAEPASRAHPLRGWAEGALQKLIDEAGLPTEPLVLDGAGGPGEIIAVAAADYDLVAMTTHQRRGLARLWWGSVAERVIRQASVPVLVVPARHTHAPAE